MIRSGSRATTSLIVTRNLLPAPCFVRSAKITMPPAISISSETHPIPEISGSSLSSKNTLGRLMLAVLGHLADVERDLIRTRTAEGRSRAKAQGQQMGRPPALSPAQQKEATRRPRRGCYSRRTRPQLQRRHIHHSPGDASRRMNHAPTC